MEEGSLGDEQRGFGLEVEVARFEAASTRYSLLIGCLPCANGPRVMRMTQRLIG